MHTNDQLKDSGPLRKEATMLRPPVGFRVHLIVKRSVSRSRKGAGEEARFDQHAVVWLEVQDFHEARPTCYASLSTERLKGVVVDLLIKLTWICKRLLSMMVMNSIEVDNAETSCVSVFWSLDLSS